jgi:hypothetical protein
VTEKANMSAQMAEDSVVNEGPADPFAHVDLDAEVSWRAAYIEWLAHNGIIDATFGGPGLRDELRKLSFCQLHDLWMEIQQAVVEWGRMNARRANPDQRAAIISALVLLEHAGEIDGRQSPPDPAHPLANKYRQAAERRECLEYLTGRELEIECDAYFLDMPVGTANRAARMRARERAGEDRATALEPTPEPQKNRKPSFDPKKAHGILAGMKYGGHIGSSPLFAG